MHTEEDYTAAKLKGYNCYIKFHDGEVIFCKVDEIDDEYEIERWMMDTEDFLNGMRENLPIKNIAIVRTSIKYIKVL